MSTFKGTPGPWEAVNGTDIFTPLAARNGAGTAAHESDGWHIADCSMGETQTEDGSESIPHREQLANARLIAAAPDSHEANVKFIEAIECLCNVTAGWTDDRIYDDLPSSGLAIAYFAARAAIAKATGGAA